MLNPVPDVSTPRGLAHLLRHKELWPDGFKWNYNNCDCCGMALLFRALGRPVPADTGASIIEAAKILNISHFRAWAIFSFFGLDKLPPGSVYDWQARSKITPEMIAQALEDAPC